MGNGQSEGVMDQEYDIVLDIDDIMNGDKGWPIFVSERMFKIQQKILAATQKTDEDLADALMAKLDIKKPTLVAILGLFNKGKTFLTNKLANSNLPADRKVNTKGISFLLPSSEEVVHDMVFMDTAGTNSPLENFNADSEMLVRKKATEMLLRDLTFYLATCIIVVVNELTWMDQQYIESLYRNIKDDPEKQSAKIFVVHNFNMTENEKDLLAMWRGVLLAYNGEPTYAVIATDEKSRKLPYLTTHDARVYHTFIAKEGSTAGKKWNPLVYSFLRQQLSAIKVAERGGLQKLLVVGTFKALRKYCKNAKNVNMRPQLEAMKATYNNRQIRSLEVEVDTSIKKKPAKSIPDEAWRERPPPRAASDDLRKCASFVLQVDEPLELTSTEVIFDGYNITLAEGPFTPKCTVVRVNEPGNNSWSIEGAFRQQVVIVDLPGVSANANLEKDYKDGRVLRGGTISATIEHGQRGAVLRIVGERIKLLRGLSEKSTDNEIVPTKPMRCDTSQYKEERKDGPFSRVFEIDGNIYDLNTPPTIFQANGVAYVCVKAKEKSNEAVTKQVANDPWA